jgi:hypothetical protein
MNFDNNPAVIKSTLSRMNKNEFIETALEIKNNFLSLDYEIENMNLKYKFKNLYDWCKAFYRKKF